MTDLDPVTPTTETPAAARLAVDVQRAREAIVETARTDRDHWWRAVDLKSQARNGWDPGAMSIAMAQLIDEHVFEVGQGLLVKLSD